MQQNSLEWLLSLTVMVFLDLNEYLKVLMLPH